MTYRLPNEQERKALFATLKQQSSLTAWERVFKYHEAFVAAAKTVYEERAGRHPSEAYVVDSDLRSILFDHAALQKAVARLRNGDKSCFKFLGAPGHFSQGLRSLGVWRTHLDRDLGMGEGPYRARRSPLWPTLLGPAFAACEDAMRELEDVLEPRHLDVTAVLKAVDPLYREDWYPHATLFRHYAASTDLPSVPDALPPKLVPTHSRIPYYGIWEPVRANRRGGGLKDMVKRWLAGETPEILGIDGCMNYLCANSPAPTIGFEEDDYRKKGRPTVWRLLWKDERYGRNGVPDEESGYVFFHPKPVPRDPAVQWSP